MYECCVSNHVQGWPKFAARQFALLPPSTDDAAAPGLAAVQYFDSESPAIVLSDGSKVSVTVKTGYPFVRSPPAFLLCVYICGCRCTLCIPGCHFWQLAFRITS